MLIVRPYAAHYDVCVDTSDYASHPYGVLVNIVTGQIAHPDENPGNGVNLGQWKRSHLKHCQRYASGEHIMYHDCMA